MLTQAQVDKIKRLCEENDLHFAVFFGSGADAKKKSIQRDYDIAFYGRRHLPGALKMKLMSALDPFFDKPIDIILIQPLMDPLLAYEISTKGELIYENKKDTFLEFQGRAWKDYLDSQRYRDYESEYIKKKVKDVT